jgi:hypothetical protein
MVDDNCCYSAVDYLRIIYTGVENYVSSKLMVPRTTIKYVLLDGSMEYSCATR